MRVSPIEDIVFSDAEFSGSIKPIFVPVPSPSPVITGSGVVTSPEQRYNLLNDTLVTDSDPFSDSMAIPELYQRQEPILAPAPSGQITSFATNTIADTGTRESSTIQIGNTTIEISSSDTQAQEKKKNFIIGLVVILVAWRLLK